MATVNNVHKQNQLLVSSNPILLLTPSPSYLSLLHLSHAVNTSPKSSGTQINSALMPSAVIVKSKNIVIESSILFLRQFKHLIKLLLNSIESNYTHGLFVNSYMIISGLETRHEHEPVHGKKGDYERLVDKFSNEPRSLKVQSRRCILNLLVGTQKRARLDNSDDRVVLIKNQVLQLPLPRKIQNYLLFIN